MGIFIRTESDCRSRALEHQGLGQGFAHGRNAERQTQVVPRQAARRRCAPLCLLLAV